MKGAIANAELGNLTGLLNKIKPAIEATQYEGDKSATNYDFDDAVARTNVQMALQDIRLRNPVLSKLEQTGEIKMVGAIYHLAGGEVEFLTR